jgi:hypothetical protein
LHDLNPNFVTLSTFATGMLKACGFLHLNQHDELCPALQFSGVTPNILRSGIARPKPFFHSPLKFDRHDPSKRPLTRFVMKWQWSERIAHGWPDGVRVHFWSAGA